MSNRSPQRAGVLLGALCALAACASDAPHQQAPVAEIQRCAVCHGDPNRPGDYLIRSSPPSDTHGNSSDQSAGVGVHLTHVLGTERSRAVPCGECHVVPTDTLPPPPGRSASVIFSGVALAGGATPSYANGTCLGTACHGNAAPTAAPFGGSDPNPQWTAPGSVASCVSCHGLPPPPPHPSGPLVCAGCHKDVSTDLLTFVRPDLHVDGHLTFVVR